MSKIIEKLIVSSTAPNNPNVGWVKQKADRSKELLIHDNNSWTPIGGSNSGSSSGGGIEIVDSVDKLDPNAELGSIASVAVQGNYSETSFKNLYQPDASMIDRNIGALTQPELLSSVSSLKVFAPTDVNNLEFELVESTFDLVSRDFSMTNENVAMIQTHPYRGVMAEVIIGGNYDSAQQFLLVEGLLRPGDMVSYTVNTDQVEAFNAVLANGMDWCYLGNSVGGFVTTEEQFDTIDLFFKAVSGKPNSIDIYVKGDKWEKLYAKDFEKIASNIGKVETSITDKINAKADKMPIESYASWPGLQPNVYTTYTISSTGNAFIKLAKITDRYTYNEYIIEIKCTSTPSSVSFKSSNNAEVVINWANDNIPIFEEGYTYIISIVNNFGVFAQFTNS